LLHPQQLLQDFTNITTTKKELKDRYSLLNGNLFTPLGSNNFITTTKTNSNIPKLIFDSWNFLNSDYISEGLKHLIKDVKYFESRVNNIKNKVS
jgi:hypothetical protein